MAAGAIRGSRIGSGPMGEAERGEAAPRHHVTFFCINDHTTELQFALEADLPDAWDCPRCGMPASIDSNNRPTAPKAAPYKTHLAYVKERRSEDEAAELLTEAIQTLRAKRKSGEIIF
ncbi:MAG: RNA polymerase-binding protein RbpA [Aeromicrobium sp.]